MDHRSAMEAYHLELCPKHKKRMDKLCKDAALPVEAVMLYYGLKLAGHHPMLAWWDGSKFVDVAFSRTKLNIEIDTEYEMLSAKQAIHDLEKRMHSYKDGFTSIRIPNELIAQHLKETVQSITNIIESLKLTLKPL